MGPAAPRVPHFAAESVRRWTRQNRASTPHTDTQVVEGARGSSGAASDTCAHASRPRRCPNFPVIERGQSDLLVVESSMPTDDDSDRGSDICTEDFSVESPKVADPRRGFVQTGSRTCWCFRSLRLTSGPLGQVLQDAGWCSPRTLLFVVFALVLIALHIWVGVFA